jgi:hypothetical protein
MLRYEASIHLGIAAFITDASYLSMTIRLLYFPTPHPFPLPAPHQPA